MRKNLLLIVVFISLFAASNAKAQNLIHYWNFNNVTTAVYTYANAPVDEAYTMVGVPAGQLWYTNMPGTNDTAYYDPYTGSDSTAGTGQGWNARFGDAAGNAIRLRNPSVNMQLLAYIPTTDHKDPVMKYVVESSNNGMKKQTFDYSVDSGMTWTTAGLSVTADTPIDVAWMPITVSISSTTDPLTQNNPKLVFRVQFQVNNTGTSGNDRIDNFTVEADTFIASSTAVATLAAEPATYALYPNPVVNTLELTGELDGTKTVMIYTADGKTAFAGFVSGRKNSIDVSNLSAGVYFVAVKETGNGKTSTLKFVKN